MMMMMMMIIIIIIIMLSCSWLMKFLRQITRLFASFLAFIFNRIWSVSNVQSIWNVSSEGFAAVWSMLRMIIMIFLSNSNQSWNITINYFKKLPDLFDWLHYEWMNSKAALSISSLESWNDNSHTSRPRRCQSSQLSISRFCWPVSISSLIVSVDCESVSLAVIILEIDFEKTSKK